MTICNIALLFLVLNVYNKNFNELKKNGFILIALGCFSFFPCFITLIQGQNSFITLLILSEAFFLLKRERDFAAGAVLALALYKPQLVMIFFFVFLFKRRWRSVIAFSCVAFLLIAISYIIVGKEGFGDYINLTLIRSPLVDGKFGIDYTAMHNWRGLFRVILGPNHKSLLSGITLTVSIASILILFSAWKGKWKSSPNEFDLKIVLTIITTLLVSPYLYIHDLTLWILPSCIILNQNLSQDVYWKKQIAVGVVIAGSFISVLTTSLQSTLYLQATTVFMAGTTILLFAQIKNISKTQLDEKQLF